jgi:hypothetical protein
MRSILTIKRIILIAGLLAGLILLTALSLPRDVGALQTTDPAPTLTPTLHPDEEPIKSEDTGSMILGAAVIFLIIIAGVTIQRVLLRKPPESN